MIRLSVSILDSYRYLVNEAPFMDEQEFARRITGPYESSTAAEFGIAFHCAMEQGRNARFSRSGKYEIVHPYGVKRDFWFDAAQLDMLRQDAGAGQEVKYQIHYPDLDALLICKTDVNQGLDVDDWKCRFGRFGGKQFDPELLADTLQWRICLVAAQAQRFKFRCVRWKEATTNGRKTYHLADYDVWSHYAYPGMAEEVKRWVTDCADYIRSNGLAGYLDQTAFDEKFPNVTPAHEVLAA